MEQIRGTASPCVGVCSTTYGDQICRGCKRLAAEIVRWNGYGEPERAAIVERLDLLAEQVLAAYIEITDVVRLHASVRRLCVRVQEGRSDWHLAAELLRTKAAQIDFEDCGIRILPRYATVAPAALRDQIEAAMMLGAGRWLEHCYGRYTSRVGND